MFITFMRIKFYVGLAVMILGLTLPFIFRSWIPSDVGLWMVVGGPFLGAFIMCITKVIVIVNHNNSQQVQDSLNLEQIKWMQQQQYWNSLKDKK